MKEGYVILEGGKGVVVDSFFPKTRCTVPAAVAVIGVGAHSAASDKT